ncbi:MAG: phage major capsid protein [Flavobacteriaceae bacterium]|nr:phage major capsid protein [Flavobacteriaceae bacterium]|tara:strand:- start:14041 stop:15360 length:1320 start_codon:yes stop_codon:yes gene_type:complete
MKKSDQLKQERASKLEELDNLITTRKNEKRDFTSEEETRFDSLEEEIGNLDTQIKREEKVEAAEKRAAEQAAEIHNPAPEFKTEGGESKEKRALSQRASVTKAIRSAMSGRELTGAEKEMNELAIEESRAAGVPIPDNSKVNIPMSFLRASAQTVSEDSGDYGGALVQDNAPRVQMPLTPAGLLDQLGVTRLRNLSGGDVPLPVMSDYDFAWLAETAAITPQKKEISGPSLSPNRLGAAVEISNRLLIQSSVDVESMIRGLIIQGYQRAIDAAAINGSGSSNQPEGILNNSSVPTGASTDADVPSKLLITELVSKLEAANSTTNNLAFLGAPGLKHLIENTKLDAGSGRFLMEKMNELFGYKFVTSTLVPALSGNFPLIFGDWSKMFIGEWGSLSVLSDPYSGALSNSVRLVLNGHADVAIAQPNAFAVNKYFNATDAT